MTPVATKTPVIQVDDLFHSSVDRIAKFAEMQVHLYRQDVSLQDYFLALDLDVFNSSRMVTGGRGSTNPFVAWSFHAADTLSQLRKRPKFKTDILFCPVPHFGRKSENRLVVRTLIGLAQTDAKVLCLLSEDAPFRHQLEAELTAIGRRKQVTFLDPETAFQPGEARMRAIAARLRARDAFEKAGQILDPYGLGPTEHALADFDTTAKHVEAWERLAPSIEFEAVVARCHWNYLCSPVCRTALQRGKPVITFQQGVVDHTLDAPISASKFVAFGAPSASVLAQANQRFFEAVGLSEPPVDFVNAGSLFDTLAPLPNQFFLQTVLFIDMDSDAGDPWGAEGQTQALLQLAKELLAAKLPMRRLVIRPHPHWSHFNFEACLELVRQHRDVCELSHPLWPLEDDLRRSSVVIGVWSGALTVASASGLPTVFMQTDRGLRTLDLDCFSPEQTLSPSIAFREVSRLLTEPESYAQARQVALRNGSEYYAGGANASLDGGFFTRLLAKGNGGIGSLAT